MIFPLPMKRTANDAAITGVSERAAMNVIAILPAYNEATRVSAVVASALPRVNQVIVVDDGSTDDTAAVAQAAGAVVIRHPENCGAGAATMTGLEAARRLGADVVVTLDADGQHDADEIPTLLQPLREGRADAVFANRFGRRNQIPLVRRFFNAIGNVITFAVTGRWVPDSQCGFRAFGPIALQQVDLRMSGYEFCTEVVREAVRNRWRTVNVPTKVLYSEYTLAKGQSFASGVKTAFRILLRSFMR
jgi:glycosyltransferase involved in cell wall biosynthesis